MRSVWLISALLFFSGEAWANRDPAQDPIELKIELMKPKEIDFKAPSRKRSLYFLDTDDFLLYELGIIIRLRLSTRGNEDSTVKVRPYSSEMISEKLSKLVIEPDLVGSSEIPSAVITRPLDHQKLLHWMSGLSDVRELFKEQQIRLLEIAYRHNVRGLGAFPWERLKIHGPIRASIWSFPSRESHEPLKVEYWKVDENFEVLELSVHTKRSELENTRNLCEKWLKRKHLSALQNPETKTDRVIQYLKTR